MASAARRHASWRCCAAPWRPEGRRYALQRCRLTPWTRCRSSAAHGGASFATSRPGWRRTQPRLGAGRADRARRSRGCGSRWCAPGPLHDLLGHGAGRDRRPVRAARGADRCRGAGRAGRRGVRRGTRHARRRGPSDAHADDGAALAYDLFSFDVGSQPKRIPAMDPAAPVIALRPIERAVAQLDGRSPTQRADGGAAVVVVGGGAGGSEVALALAARLRGQPRAITVCDRRSPSGRVARAAHRAALVERAFTRPASLHRRSEGGARDPRAASCSRTAVRCRPI